MQDVILEKTFSSFNTLDDPESVLFYPNEFKLVWQELVHLAYGERVQESYLRRRKEGRLYQDTQLLNHQC